MIMLKVVFFLASILMLAFPVLADDAAWRQFERAQHAVKSFNFDVTFVQFRTNQPFTYRWLHGIHQQGGALPVATSVEKLMSQDDIGTDIFRRNDRVYYASPSNPVFVTINKSIKELPPILFQSPSIIAKVYDAVLGSSTSLSGRTAQLLRLTAFNNTRYSYWLWLDGETGFPLRVDTVDANNEVLERWMVVHLQIMPTLPAELQSLVSVELPQEPAALAKTATKASSYQLTWLPEGYQILPQQLPTSALNNPLQAAWLLSDGIHEISVFVQQNSGMPAQAFREGATTLLIAPRSTMDVVVIGPLSVGLANQLAASVELLPIE